jgi:basic membrane protein A and related proteins
MPQRWSKLLRAGVPAAVVALTVSVLAACGSSSSSSPSSSSSSSSAGSSGQAPVKVGLAQPVPSNDHSFGEAVHNGVVQAENQLGIKLTEIDSLVTPSAQLTALRDLARTGNNLVIMDAVAAQGIPQQYPNTQFAILDGVLPPAPNDHSVLENWLPVSYLAGVAAAHITKTHVIGFIGGIPIPVILQADQGYAAGAKSVDPSIKVVSTNIGSFTDSVKGKSAAQAEIAAGADVLYADLDTAHTGIVEAAKQGGKSVKVIGSVAPKCDISQGIDIGDTVFDETKIVFTLVKTYVDQHKLPPTVPFGLQGGYSSFQLCPGASASLTKAIASTTAGLLSGKITP